MHVIDTSLWIEAFVGSPLGLEIKPRIADVDRNTVPTFVQHELHKWLCRNGSLEDAERMIAFTMTCPIVPLDTAIALRASNLAQQFRLHASDAIIYATAIETGATLMTCDAHFSSLPDVVYFPKP